MNQISEGSIVEVEEYLCMPGTWEVKEISSRSQQVRIGRDGYLDRWVLFAEILVDGELVF